MHSLSRCLTAALILCAIAVGRGTELPPSFTVEPVDQVLREGQDLAFGALATGSQPLACQWFRDGLAISDSTNGSLTIRDIRLTNAGSYQVIVTNVFGAVTSSPAMVTITPAPTNPGAVDLGFIADIQGNSSATEVNAIVLERDGRILIGGYFTSVNGVSRNNLARVETGGIVDLGFMPTPMEIVSTLAPLPEGRLLVSGWNGWNWIMRLHADGLKDTNFVAPSGKGLIGLQSDGKPIIKSGPGCGFWVHRLNDDGRVDTTFTPSGEECPQGGSGFHFTSYGAIQPDDRILLGGDYSWRRMNQYGGIDYEFNSSLRLWESPRLRSFAFQSDGKILVGQYPAGFPLRSRLARLHRDGNGDESFVADVNTNSIVHAILALPDGKTVIGGSFTNVNGVPRNGVARLNADGSLDASFASGAGVAGTVNALAMDPEGRILVGGRFNSVDGLPRYGLVRLLGDPASAPVITRHPASRTNVVGRSELFDAAASYVPASSFQWQFNGSAIENVTNRFFTLDNLRATNAGDYTVVVSNALGVVTSAVATLTVEPAPAGPGTLDVDFQPEPGADGDVMAVAIQPDGQILIGGRFFTVNGVVRSSLARMNADGSLDPSFDPGSGANDSIRTIVVQPDGKVLVGGAFTNFNGVSRRGIARLFPDGSVDQSFNPSPDAPATVNDIVVLADGRIMVAGAGLARLWPDGRRDSGFYTSPSDYGALAVQSDGMILVGGGSRVDRFFGNGTTDYAFRGDLTNYVGIYSLAVQGDGRILVGGSTSGGTSASLRGVTRLDPLGNVDTSFNPTGLESSYDTRVVAVSPHTCGRVLAAGLIRLTNGPARLTLVRFEQDGDVDAAFTVGGPVGVAKAVAIGQGGRIVLGGSFTSYQGARRHGVVRLNTDPPEPPFILTRPNERSVAAGHAVPFGVTLGSCPDYTFQWQFNGVDIPWATNLTLWLLNPRATNAGDYRVIVRTLQGASTTGAATTLTVTNEPWRPGSVSLDFYPYLNATNRPTAWAVRPDGSLLVAMRSTNSLGQVSYRVLRSDAVGNLSEPGPVPIQANGPITALAGDPNGGFYLGGSFSTVSSTALTALARINADGTLDTNFVTNTTSPVNAMALQRDGRLVIAGAVSMRVNSGGTPDFFVGGAKALVQCDDGKIVFAGSFTEFNRTNCPRIARFKPNGALDSTFYPGSGANDIINAVAACCDGRLVIGGAFSSFDGVTRNRVARLNSDGSLDTGFDPGAGPMGTVSAVAVQPDGKVWIGGAFSYVNGVPRANLARLNADGSLDATADVGSGANGTVTWMSWRGDGKLFIGGFFTQVDGLERNRVALLNVEPWMVQPSLTGNAFRVTLGTVLNRIYLLEMKDSLNAAAWTTVTNLIGDGLMHTLSADNASTGSQRFYRIRVE